MVKEMIVRLDVSEEQVQRLMQLLPHWQQYIDNDGKRPFADWTIDDLFQSVMFIGSRHTINKHLDGEEWRQDLKKSETPAAGTAGESGTTK